jgi:5'(3')-deoxyribonucleotidase
MKIGIDLDEVLVGFLAAFIDYYNDTYKTSLQHDQVLAYHRIWEPLGVTPEESMNIIHDFHQTPFFKNMEPLPGAQAAIASLKQNHELFVITSRQDSVADITKEWVNKYFPDAFSDIILTNNFSLTGISKTKKEYCESLDIQTLIDDQLTYALECVAPQRQVYLFDKPWNKNDELPAGIKRVYSWQEIIDGLD